MDRNKKSVTGTSAIHADPSGTPDDLSAMMSDAEDANLPSPTNILDVAFNLPHAPAVKTPQTSRPKRPTAAFDARLFNALVAPKAPVKLAKDVTPNDRPAAVLDQPTPRDGEGTAESSRQNERSEQGEQSEQSKQSEQSQLPAVAAAVVVERQRPVEVNDREPIHILHREGVVYQPRPSVPAAEHDDRDDRIAFAIIQPAAQSASQVSNDVTNSGDSGDSGEFGVSRIGDGGTVSGAGADDGVVDLVVSPAIAAAARVRAADMAANRAESFQAVPIDALVKTIFSTAGHRPVEVAESRSADDATMFGNGSVQNDLDLKERAGSEVETLKITVAEPIVEPVADPAPVTSAVAAHPIFFAAEPSTSETRSAGSLFTTSAEVSPGGDDCEIEAFDYEKAEAEQAARFKAEDEAERDYLNAGSQRGRSGAWWTVPLMCAGIAIAACAVLVPAADENRRAMHGLIAMNGEVAYYERQSDVNKQFLQRLNSDPALAERLAMRQLRMSRPDTRIVQVPQKADPFSMSPYALVNIEAPAPQPAYQPAGGLLTKVFLDNRRQLYLAAIGLLLTAAGVILGGRSVNESSPAAALA